MIVEKRVRRRLGALFLFGLMLFSYPVLSLFNRDMTLFGFPLLHLYLFFFWAILIVVIFTITHAKSKKQP